MMTRNVTLTLEKAREWFNSGNAELKEIALQAFTEKELATPNFKIIKTFEDAMNALQFENTSKSFVWNHIKQVARISIASAAIIKLNIIRRALNLGENMEFTKGNIYYPYNPFVTKSSTYYKSDINLCKMEIIGKFKCEGEEYNVLSGRAYDNGGLAGLGDFYSNDNVGYVSANIGFLGCANKEIAKHLGKYFCMLITESKYGDLPDFEIVEDKYGNA